MRERVTIEAPGINTCVMVY